MHTVEFLGKQRRVVQILIGSLLLMLVGTGDYFASSSLLEFSVFFLIPVAFFTWLINRKAGILASFASAATTLGANAVSPLHVLHPHVAYWNALIWLGFFIASTLIVAELKTLHLRERRLSRVDSLTSISNRLAFYEFATMEKNRARRNGQPITLAYLDLDGFKEVNDRFGHRTGDAVLTMVAEILKSNIRQTDMAARMGGDEFALILPDTDEKASSVVLTKVLRKLQQSMRQDGWPVTFSMGAMSFATVPDSLEEMIESADTIMFSIKNSGKDRLQQEVWSADPGASRPSGQMPNLKSLFE